MPAQLTPLGLKPGISPANLSVWFAVEKGALSTALQSRCWGDVHAAAMPEGTPAGKVPPNLHSSTTHIPGGSPAPKPALGTEPLASPSSLTSAPGSSVSAFSSQAGSGCFSYPQRGAPSPVLASPTSSVSPWNPRPSLPGAILDLSLCHLVNKVPFYLVLT